MQAIRQIKAARECTKRGPDWAKGFVRQSAAEFELVAIKPTEGLVEREDETPAKGPRAGDGYSQSIGERCQTCLDMENINKSITKY